MSVVTHTTPRTARVSRAWVALGCLLSFTSSFNLTVLVDVLARNLPAHRAPAVSEVGEAIDEDADMLRASSGSKDGRRGERKQPPACLAPRLEPSSCPRFYVPPPVSHASRPGCEHALRNGLGVPLLC
jgi:hypothetical protein